MFLSEIDLRKVAAAVEDALNTDSVVVDAVEDEIFRKRHGSQSGSQVMPFGKRFRR